MKATFVETTGFTDAVTGHLSDDRYADLQYRLMENPDAGDVMPGCGGLRKIRVGDPKRRKGKRGGARVIYLHLPAAARFYMIDVYGKDDKDDLSPTEKKRSAGWRLGSRKQRSRPTDDGSGEHGMAINPRKPFFERLKAGLEEGIAHARGELTLKSVEVPAPPPEIDAKTLIALREEAAMSQGVFAKVLDVSAKTVQSWEQGVRVPSMAARRLIHIFTEQPAVVCRVVGLPPVQLRGFKVESIGKGRRRIVRKQGKIAAVPGR